MDLLNERIKERRLELGLTLKELAKKIGVRDATVQRYESGEIKNIKRDTINKLAEALNCSSMYLMGWINFLYPGNQNFDEFLKYENVFDGEPRIIQPFTDKSNSSAVLAEPCGKFIVSGKSLVPDFCITVRDDSMIDLRIKAGDVVFVKAQSTILDGEIAAIVIENTAYIRRFFKDSKNITLTAACSDTNFGPMVFPIRYGKKIKIIGKVIAFQSEI